MSFDTYRPTAAERRAIDRAYKLILDTARDPAPVMAWEREERRGYGAPSQRVPQTAARAFIVKAYRHGTENPNTLLRDAYDLRPAAAYLRGMGARDEASGKIDPERAAVLDAAREAHEAAFARMMEKDRAA